MLDKSTCKLYFSRVKKNHESILKAKKKCRYDTKKLEEKEKKWKARNKNSNDKWYLWYQKDPYESTYSMVQKDPSTLAFYTINQEIEMSLLSKL